MYMTLEVSKLSGWLKADARCRVEGRACDAGKERCEPGGGEGLWGGGGTQKACMGMARLKGWGQGHARSAHAEHDAHVCDAGGVEAQWLVEGRRGLPSQREGMRCGEGEVQTGSTAKLQ